MLKTLVAFTGVVWLLFGNKSDLYRKLRQLLTTLMSEDAEANSQKYYGVRARQIFWLVIVDAKMYCKQALTASQFNANNPFPESKLQKYDTLIENAAALELREFPEKWKTDPLLGLERHQEPSPGSWPAASAPAHALVGEIGRAHV